MRKTTLNMQQMIPAIKFAARHVSNSWLIFAQMDEVRALQRSFRLFLWRLGDVIALLWRLLKSWFLRTKLVQACLAWYKRTCKAVNDLPQYRFLVRYFRRMKENVALRWLSILILGILLELPACFAPIEYDEHIYVVSTSDNTYVVEGTPDFTYTGDKLVVKDVAANDAQIILMPHQNVTVRYGSKTLVVESYRETVANLLERLHMTVGKDEMIGVNVAGGTPLIHIDDELHYRRSSKTVDPYKTEITYNYLLPQGEYVVLQEGQPGYIADVYEDVYRDGEIVESSLIDRSDSTAVTQIVEYGRLVDEVERDDTIDYDHPYNDGTEGGYLVFDSGYSMTYSRKVKCNATAYYGGTHTATGHATGVGVIAVDPTVFPYHTRMFIQTLSASRVYGIGQAEDCGGAVKGNIIDLWFGSYGECVQWGRRDVDCWILD